MLNTGAFFDFAQMNHRVGRRRIASETVLLFVAYVSGGAPISLESSVLLHVLGHINPYQRLFVYQIKYRQGLLPVVFPTPSGTGEDKASGGTFGSASPARERWMHLPGHWLLHFDKSLRCSSSSNCRPVSLRFSQLADQGCPSRRGNWRYQLRSLSATIDHATLRSSQLVAMPVVVNVNQLTYRISTQLPVVGVACSALVQCLPVDPLL